MRTNGEHAMPSRTIFLGGLVLLVSSTLAGCPGPGGEGESNVTVGPTANFLYLPDSGDAPLTVSFWDASLEGSSRITSYLWEFGDGDWGASSEGSHIYETPGIYDISLTVTTNVGSDTLLAVDLITVLSPLWGTWLLNLAIEDEYPGDFPMIPTYEMHFLRFNEDNTVVWQVAGREAVAEYTEDDLLVRIDDDFVFSPGTPDEEFFASVNFLMTYTPGGTVAGSFSFTDSTGMLFRGTLWGYRV